MNSEQHRADATTAQLAIELRPDDGSFADGFLRADASVACRGFAGHTEFPIASRDLAAFAADVDAIQRGESDVAQLLGGWDAGSEKLRVRVARAGATGSFTVRVTVANVGMRNDQWHRVETQFVSDGASLLEFVRRLAETSGIGTAALVGHADAIA